MKKFSFKINEILLTVCYGTAGEINEEASKTIALPKEINNTGVSINYGLDGLVVSAVKGESRKQDAKEINTAILRHLLHEIGGEELPEDILNKIAEDYTRAAKLVELEMEEKEIGD